MLKTTDFYWNRIFEERVYASDSWKDLCQFLSLERQRKGDRILPSELNVFRAFDLCGFNSTKCVILGPEPYYSRGLAVGLAYSVPYDVTKYPPSLKNIHKALKVDLGMDNIKSGSLNKWARNGVLLLNTVLTVEEGRPESHFHKGWEKLTNVALDALNEDDRPKVFMLWGKAAHTKRSLINNPKHLILETSHPSPFSAGEGFLFCKHFSKCNEFLTNNGRAPVDWTIG